MKERLTEKNNKDYTADGKEYLTYPIGDVIYKLGQLEDIEDELGIDLITLFKALENGIYVYENYTKKIVLEEVELFIGRKIFKFKEARKEIGLGRRLSDYGTQWALTKEELL